MPAVIDAPEVVAYEEQDFQEEQPQVCAAHPGFWQTVKQYVRRHSAHRLQRTPSSSHGSVHPFELPVDAWARRYPALYLQAFAGE
jgi:hypothetical protein